MDKNFYTSSQKSSNPHSISIQRKFAPSGITEKKVIKPSGIFYTNNPSATSEVSSMPKYVANPEAAVHRKPYRMNSVSKASNFGGSFKSTYAPLGEPKSYVHSDLRSGFKEQESSREESQVSKLKLKIEELEKRLKAKDAEISRIKEQNKRLLEEKIKIEMRYRRMEDDDANNRRVHSPTPGQFKYSEEQRRSADEEQSEENDIEQEEQVRQPNTRDLEQRLFSMLMQSNLQDLIMHERYEEQKEQEMIELAIQESLKENPNVDAMDYEQLQELGERIGVVSKGFSNAEISLIPSKTCFSTKGDCSICLEQIKMHELIKTLACGHEFHKDCIDCSLKESKKCPCCMNEHVIFK